MLVKKFTIHMLVESSQTLHPTVDTHWNGVVAWPRLHGPGSSARQCSASC